MDDFALFLMDYTFMLRIIIFLRHTDANNDLKEHEKKIINRDVIDDILVSNIKNYLRWDMFQNDGRKNIVRLFLAQDVDYYEIIEILYNVASAIQLMNMSDNLSRIHINNHIDIIKKLDMRTSISNIDGKIIPKMENIYNPAIFVYFLKRRDAILEEIQTPPRDRELFYYPSPYNYADNFKDMFARIARRGHYADVIDVAIFEIGNMRIDNADDLTQFTNYITDGKLINNPNARRDVEQILTGKNIILFNKKVLDIFDINASIFCKDDDVFKKYENYYLWIHGLHTGGLANFNFFFSVYDPFRLFFMETFIVGKNIRGGAVEKRAPVAPKTSNHVIYLIVCLIVILFMFCYIQSANAVADMPRHDPYNSFISYESLCF